ncbi:MAG: carboxypeptidase-like regulatory domain-containing protein, partial [Bacteroidia bacterium]|nr:carboxypeptidase-like regulatory domain-containing protein [Bacteroidia bacterium]
MRFGLIIFLLFLEWTSSIAQINSVNGKVVDSQTNYPLAFVNITANEQKAGTATDIDGKFLLQSPESIKQLTFSYVGYEKLKINPENKKNLLVKLKKTNYELPELVVLPGENPAHRIIKKVTENRDIN